jgi:uncharacterized protein YndB with AHSA1/START domain
MARTGGLMLERIAPESLREATGRDWDGWLATLDAVGAMDWGHGDIVAYLGREHGDATTSWWRQSIAVGYEQARGRRVVGETRETGFQLGVQRTVAASLEDTWSVLVSRMELWLGEGTVALEEGEQYEVAGASGEIRVVRPRERLRLTWQADAWPGPATLQLTLAESASGKTTIQAHLERLPDAEAREAMRARWRQALARLASALEA